MLCCKKSKRVEPVDNLAKPHLANPLQLVQKPLPPRNPLPVIKVGGGKNILGATPAPAPHSNGQPLIRRSVATVAKRLTKGGNSYGINIVKNNSELELNTNFLKERVEANEPDFHKTPDMRQPPNRGISIESLDNGLPEEKHVHLESFKADSNLASMILQRNSPYNSTHNMNSGNQGSTFSELAKNPHEIASLKHIQTKKDVISIYQIPNEPKLSAFKGRELVKMGSSNSQFDLSLPPKERTRSYTPSKDSKVGGYRTLRYHDLLGNGGKSRFDDDDGSNSMGAFQNSHFQSRGLHSESGFLSNRGSSHKYSQMSGQSIMVGGAGDAINDINKNDYSCLEFSFQPSSANDSAKNQLRGVKQSESIKMRSTNDVDKSKEEEIDEKVNKELLTTYIKSTEMLNARKSSDIVGFVVTGKRTKINQYILVSSIGKGGWGEVYMAVDANTKEKYVRDFHSGHEGD